MLRSTASVRCRPEDHQGISQARRVYPLGELDLILTVSGQVLTFTYVGADGDLPPFLN